MGNAAGARASGGDTTREATVMRTSAERDAPIARERGSQAVAQCSCSLAWSASDEVAAIDVSLDAGASRACARESWSTSTA